MWDRHKYTILWVLLAAVTLIAIFAHDSQPTPVYGIADQVEQVRGSVVHVAKEGVCQGSGCIVDPAGIVLTAKHMTGGTSGSYVVTTDSGDKYRVKYVVEDREHDVAFLQLDLPAGTRLPAARFADLSDVRVGDAVFAMGSPLGRVNINSVSLGVLSARQRDFSGVAPYGWRVLFQSDAPGAYPGNSGGPVFDIEGRVIGIIVRGYGPGLNYSVPVAVVMYDLDTVRAALALRRFEDKPPAPAIQWPASGHSYE